MGGLGEGGLLVRKWRLYKRQVGMVSRVQVWVGVACLSVFVSLVGWLVCLLVWGGAFSGVWGVGVVCFGLCVRKCQHYERQVSRVQMWVGVACLPLSHWLVGICSLLTYVALMVSKKVAL